MNVLIKRIIALRVVFIVLLMFSGMAFGHGGGLNSEGCHNDNVGTEGFHCHNDGTDPEPLTYSWSTGSWGICTGECGTNQGTKTRAVTCISSEGNLVSDSNCSGTKPATTSACTESECDLYEWNAGAWSSCSGECGSNNGIKTRTVVCKSSLGSTVSGAFCSSSKPVTSTTCTESMCEIETDPVNYPATVKNSSVLRGGLNKNTSVFSVDTAELPCMYTSLGLFDLDLVVKNTGFGISSLDEVSSCEAYSGKFSFLTSIVTIFDINVGNDNFRASLELDNNGGFNLVHARNIDDTSVTVSTEYNRDDWGNWKDLDGDCQDTRSEVLAIFNQEDNNPCTASSGTWLDPYTGTIFTNASDIDIDHIVPVSYAHNHGGAGWSEKLKEQFYNDQENLLPVSASANRSKGSKSPDEWMPDNADYACIYVDSFVYIAEKYHLDLQNSEWTNIENMCTKKRIFLID